MTNDFKTEDTMKPNTPLSYHPKSPISTVKPNLKSNIPIFYIPLTLLRFRSGQALSKGE